MPRKEKVPHGLVEVIRTDKKLDEETRMEYLSLAQAFSELFRENIVKTSIELDEMYPFGMDVWQKFLSYAPVKRYIETFRNELISQSANVAMMTGTRSKDALAVKKELERENSDNTFENFVVFRLPDKENEYELTGDL